MAARLPPHWEAAKDPQTGRTYFQNHVTRETQWHPPEPEPVPVPQAYYLYPNPQQVAVVPNPQQASGQQMQVVPTTTPVTAAGQLPAQVSMTSKAMNRTNSILGPKAQMHPLIGKLEAGLRIYSQSFWDDCWLTFKNSHIVVSCFTVHPSHHFTAGERCGVLVSSLLVAFGLSALLESQAQDSMSSTIVFAAYSFALQYAYDYFAESSVSCSCVQRSENRIKDCFECIGKFAFIYLAFLAISIFAAGLAMVSREEEGSSSAVIALISFGVTRAANFIFSSSLSHLVFFAHGRNSQMKPSAEVLATEEGKKKWTTPTRLPLLICLEEKAPNEMWDTHIGPRMTFADLPLHAPDYDWRVKISLICWSCVIYEHKAKNAEGTPQVREYGLNFVYGGRRHANKPA